MRATLRCGILSAALVVCADGRAQSIPIEAFAAGANILDAAISADGHYLAIVSTARQRHVVMVRDLQAGVGAPYNPVLADKEEGGQLRWCRFAGGSRLVCGFRGLTKEVGHISTWTRMVAVDVDGKNTKILLRGDDAATGQFQDDVIDWRPGKPDTIWVQSEEVKEDVLRARRAGGSAWGATTSGGYPAVFELNTITGASHIIEHARPPIWRYFSDGRGHLRFAWGIEGKSVRYFVHDEGGQGWKSLVKYEVFSNQGAQVLKPVAADPDNPHWAYAFGAVEGREALWHVDLTDKESPSVVFAHPSVDVTGAEFAKDGHLLGVHYDTDLPFMRYTDPLASDMSDSLKAALPNQYIVILDYTDDHKLSLVRASSDVDAGTYYLENTEKHELLALGKVYSKVDSTKLPRMRSVSYEARDGTKIPAYLTVPVGARPEMLPLIVMPHGGPIARDRWQYFFLRQFLANRGYAVLQMNFRGSAGYGQDWFHAAHQDWGGLTYSDIVDGTEWAIRQGIADPKRICVVGWSFGGYAALLSATRDSHLYKCSVSIAGVSDLSLLLSQRSYFMAYEISREQIGNDAAKRAADSPRRHADAVSIPILMIHGDMDPQVDLDESEVMASALKHAGKPYEFVVLKGADHQIEKESDRITLLTAVEKFLRTHLGEGVNAAP